MIRRQGKFGDFLGCSNFPTCKYSENIFEKKNNIFENTNF
jgi:ssDNA-binding Zn-finger/Zn-ribbon topoisomerase 1